MPSDEAVLRILLQDSGQGSTATGGGAGAPAGSGPSTDPGVKSGADYLVNSQDYARSLLKSAEQDLATFQRQQHEMGMAGADAKVSMQDRARSILAGAQEDLEKFQEEHAAKQPGQFDLLKSGSALMRGDVPGALQGMGLSADAVASAVPVAGIALAAKAVADKINREVVEGIKGGIGTAGSIATSVASVNQDVTVPLNQLSTAASEAGESLMSLAPELGVFMVGLGESGKALTQLMQAVDATAKHYEQYSAEVAMAAARAEVRQTTRDIRRANRLGAGLADYVTAKSKLENDVEDIKAALLEMLLPLITNIVNGISDSIHGTEKIVTVMGLLNRLSTEGMVSQESQLRILTQIYETLFKKNEEVEIQDPTTILFKQGALAKDIEERARPQG